MPCKTSVIAKTQSSCVDRAPKLLVVKTSNDPKHLFPKKGGTSREDMTAATHIAATSLGIFLFVETQKLILF